VDFRALVRGSADLTIVPRPFAAFAWSGNAKAPEKERSRMPKGFLPNADQALLYWSKNFSAQINADYGAYGLSLADATQYAALHASFAAALAASAPQIRSVVSTAAKNEARALLRMRASQLSSIIKGQSNVTDVQRIALGLNVRAKPTKSPRPEAAPGLSVESVRGWTVRIRLYDVATSGTRARPARTSGAALFSFIGDEPPTNASQWRFEQNTGSTLLEVTFPATIAPGTGVWLSAAWFDGRKRSGPMSEPIRTNLQGGGVSLPAGLALAA
jgi:hypothetical protein